VFYRRMIMCTCRICRLITSSTYGRQSLDKVILEMFLALIMREYGATECIRTRRGVSKNPWTERPA
jgi:hypothetical protein